MVVLGVSAHGDLLDGFFGFFLNEGADLPLSTPSMGYNIGSSYVKLLLTFGSLGTGLCKVLLQMLSPCLGSHELGVVVTTLLGDEGVLINRDVVDQDLLLTNAAVEVVTDVNYSIRCPQSEITCSQHRQGSSSGLHRERDLQPLRRAVHHHRWP